MNVCVLMTTAGQETAVGEGLALGCVALGRESFMASKMVIEFAFGRAWRTWGYHRLFPAVHGSLERNDLLRIIAKSPRRRSAHLAGWSGEWPFVAYVADGWALDDIADLIDEPIHLEGWTDLASAFLEQVAA